MSFIWLQITLQVSKTILDIVEGAMRKAYDSERRESPVAKYLKGNLKIIIKIKETVMKVSKGQKIIT